MLAYVAFTRAPISRAERVSTRKGFIHAPYDDRQREFLDFVLDHYIQQGEGELDQEKLPHLLELKDHAVADAITELGGASYIREVFVGFQAHLYARETS